MTKKKITRFIAALTTAGLVSSCTLLTKQQQQVIAKAESIGTAPIRREKIVTVFDLKEIPSTRFGGSVRSGRMYFSETWQHPSGLSIIAFDSEYVGPLEIVPMSIDSIVNNPERKTSDFISSGTIDGVPTLTSTGQPKKRKTFHEILLKRQKKEVFRSTK